MLKYLNEKREKYAVSAEAGFYVEMLRNRIRSKRAALVKIAEDVARECAAATTSLKVQEEQDMECKVLRLNLTKKKELRAEEELRTEDLRQEIATMRIGRLDIRGRILAQTKAHNEELQRANKLKASL